MKTEMMTPAWVVENFLPDYEKRYREECNRYKFALGNEISNPELVRRFIMRFFPEALLGLLKAQREVCADNAKIQRVVVDHNGTNNEFGYIVDRESIINSPIPEPKNRK